MFTNLLWASLDTLSYTLYITGYMTTYKYLNKIIKSNKKLFSSQDIQEVLGIKSKKTLEDVIKKFVNARILTRLERGKYLLTNANISDFEIAQFLYSPSYVSFETALNYHGILSQFPVEITSATTKFPTQKVVIDKLYSYSKIKINLFTGYCKEKNFLIAYPEKALFDQLYMIAKGVKTEEYLDEMDYINIDKNSLNEYIVLLPENLKSKISGYIGEYL